MNKVLFVLFRKPDLTHERCLAEWGDQRHVKVLSECPGLTRWVQNRVTSIPNGVAPDGIGELWFETPQALERAMNSPEMAAAVEDAKRFLDMGRTCALVVDEKAVVG
jgi:uncharacterized protein (TIGR02118 family)